MVARNFLKASLFLLALFLCLFIHPLSVQAATITVDTTIDEAATNDGNCTLREAITAANTDATVDTCTAGSGTDTINIPAGTIQLSAGGGGLPTITTPMTVQGVSAATTILDANGLVTGERGFYISGLVAVNINHITVKNGRPVGGTGSSGGGIQSGSDTFTMTDVILENNAATTVGGQGGQGGGINIFKGTLTNVTIQNNTATRGGGGIYMTGLVTLNNVTIKGNDAGFGSGQGGGIYDVPSGTTTLFATNVTISGNSAAGGGGGIWIDNSGVSFTNVTISGNTANRGGGIYDFSFVNSGFDTYTNVTIANNTATISGGGIYYDVKTIKFKNVLLDNNTLGNCGRLVATGAVSLGNNMSSDGTCTGFNQTGDQNNVSNISLAPLADNGGSVQTLALQSGSAAIDAGTDTGAPATDARGTSRPQDGNNDGSAVTDIGSYEYVYVAPTSVPSSGGSTSSSSSVASTTDTPVCGDLQPEGIPELFQINTHARDATLYFTPVQSNTSYYYVAYGFTPGDQRFGVQFDKQSNEGIQDFTIRGLNPNTTYYFQMRAGNGCQPGEFSNALKTHTSRSLLQKLIFYLHGSK